MFAQKLHSAYFLNSIQVSFHVALLFLLGFVPSKADQSLQGTELQEKKGQGKQEITLERTYS